MSDVNPEEKGIEEKQIKKLKEVKQEIEEAGNAQREETASESGVADKVIRGLKEEERKAEAKEEERKLEDVAGRAKVRKKLNTRRKDR